MSSIPTWLETMGWWHAGEPTPETIAKIAAMPAEQEAEIIAALRSYADTCPADSTLATRPYFRFLGNRSTPLQDFQMLAYIVGRRRAADALPVLRSLYREHRSDDVRLSAGHAMLMIPGTADDVAAGATELAATAPGWFRLWVGAEVMRSPSTSFDAIDARRATAADPAAALASMLEAGALLGAIGRPWCELCASMLGEWRPNVYALRILAQNKDQRMIPALRSRLSDPDYGTISEALELLAIGLEGDELPEAVIALYDESSNKAAFEAAFASMPAGRKLIAHRTAKRLEAVLQTSHPFLFLGAQPADWYEGANDGHLYIVCFDGTLDAAKLAKLGKAVAKLPKRAAIAKRAWTFGELDGNTWAYFHCGGKPFEQLRTSLPAIHKSVKLREVIFGGIREVDDADDWTLWSQHQPGLAKRVPMLDPQVDTRMIMFFRGRDVVPVEGRRDDTFEAARTAPKPPKAT